MLILAIETSCDETALALIEASGGVRKPKFEVLESFVSSQIKIHRPFGGVVPSLAKREHQKNLPKIFKKMTASEHWKTPDLIAATVGPGLEPALWQGIEFAQKISGELEVPFVGANHLEGHLYSNWLTGEKIEFPAVVLLVSGGHTILALMKSLTKWEKLGETRDDAAGEAFDKVAKMLNLPYPGGPEVEKLAKQGNSQAMNFPRPMLREPNYEFSFSGLKTSVLYYLKDINFDPAKTKDVCASFQQAVIDTLVGKTIRAAKEFDAKSILLCGGVAANHALRHALKTETENLGLAFHAPEFIYNTDNAVMIAAAAYIRHLRKKLLKLNAQPNLSL